MWGSILRLNRKRELNQHVRAGVFGVGVLLMAGCIEGQVSRQMDQPRSCDAPGAPGSATVRLLTRAEYNASVSDLLGTDMTPANAFPAENQFLGFDNNADVHLASQPLVNEYEIVAFGIAATTVADQLDVVLSSVDACATDYDLLCGLDFVDDFSRRAFRRSPTEDERAAFVGLFTRVLAESGFDVAVEVFLSAVLQSPQFLYRNEHDGTLLGNGTVMLSSAAVASRLSYFLWGTTPDEELLTLIDADALLTKEAVENQARRMLEDPKAQEGMESFYSQWLHTRNFENLTKSSEAYPDFSPTLALELRESLHRFMDDVLGRPDGFSALFSSPDVYVNDAVGDIYGLPASGGDFAPVAAPAEQRAGLLTQPALMALLGHSDQSSPVDRGIFVREAVMCEIIAAPPPEIVVIAPEPDPNSTTRERFAEHTANEKCSSCHALIDPVGFAFEHYDGMGNWRDLDSGMPVDASGELVGSNDPELNGPINSAIDLSQRLSRSNQVADCMATQMFRFAMGRAEMDADFCTIDVMGQRLQQTGDFREMLVSLVGTDAFRMRAATEAELGGASP